MNYVNKVITSLLIDSLLYKNLPVVLYYSMIRSVDQFACQQPVGWSVSCLPVGVSVCLSVHLCVCVSICVCLSIGLSVGEPQNYNTGIAKPNNRKHRAIDIRNQSNIINT